MNVWISGISYVYSLAISHNSIDAIPLWPVKPQLHSPHTMTEHWFSPSWVILRFLVWLISNILMTLVFMEAELGFIETFSEIKLCYKRRRIFQLANKQTNQKPKSNMFSSSDNDQTTFCQKKSGTIHVWDYSKTYEVIFLLHSASV